MTLTIEQHRKARADRKRRGVFHVGHFPVGTVVEIENPFNSFQPDALRKYPDEAYARSTTTVVSVKANGSNSFLLELVDKCPISVGLRSINIEWVRGIVSRGNGKLMEADQLYVDAIRAEAAAKYDASYDYTYSYQQVNGNCYGITDLRHFLHDYLVNHPQYKTTEVGGHLIDFEILYQSVLLQFPKLQARKIWETVSVNKKRMARVFKAAYARSKVSRKYMAAQDARFDMIHYDMTFDADLDLIDDLV